MTSTLIAAPTPPRLHPALATVFKGAEARHFSDEELAAILKQFPNRAPALATARLIREKDVAVISRVVKEVYAQYPYEAHHEFATSKCPRDVRYVVIYATHAMISGEPRGFDDKILIWLKTILQAFDFPERIAASGPALFADEVLEEKLAKLPKKARSIYHLYYRLKQEMAKALTAEHFAPIEPYLEQALNVLTEDY